MMKKVFMFLFAIITLASVSAQNETKKWAVGGGVSAIDFSGPITKDFFDFDEYKGQGRFFVGRYLNPSFNAKMDFTFGKVWYPTITAYPETLDGIYQLRHIYDLGLTFEYKFNNGYIFKEEAVVAPYIFAGIGMNSIVDYDVNTYAPFGLGINIRPSDWLTINLQSAYKLNIDNSYDYTQHSASLVYNFGKSKKGEEIVENEVTDADSDGVPDLIDECPFAAGTQAFFGCPDTDGDGVGDSRDNCPLEAGPADNKGCPSNDTDGDGVADDKDSCPNIAGEKRYAGCPDTDGDGIVDKYDKCPTEAGTASNSGCPKPAEVVEVEETIPTPEKEEVVSTPTEPVATATNDDLFIYFTSGSSTISSSEKKKLDKISATLSQNSSYKVKLFGHTDNAGDDYDNVNLSLDRATSVWNYLSSKGLKGNRVELFGMGEYYPQDAAAAKNRVVVVEIIK